MPDEAHPHVSEVHLKDDDSVDLVVEVVGFNADEWAEISGYIFQQDGTFAPFSAIQKAPPSPTGGPIPTVMVSLPAMDRGLDPKADVTVITRMTKAQIWPTPLAAGDAKAAAGDATAAASDARPGVKAIWLAKNGNSTEKSPAYESGRGSVASEQVDGVQSNTGPTMRVNGGPGDTSVTVTGLRIGTKVTVTIEAVDTGGSGDTNT